jgi:beta-N-acetylhexosaminidase
MRDEIAFRGLLLSDDLEMRAVAAQWEIEDAAVLAIAAGCDALLVCESEEQQERAVSALEREAARSPAFAARCDDAHARMRAARERATARPAADDDALARAIGGPPSLAVAAEIAQRAT